MRSAVLIIVGRICHLKPYTAIPKEENPNELDYIFLKNVAGKTVFHCFHSRAISMLASSLHTIVDGAVVRQFLGATAFAAINLALPFVNINFSLADLIGVGSSVPIFIHLEKKQEKEANNIFTCSCLLIVGIGLFIGAAMFAAAPLLICLMGAEGDFAKLAVQYMQVYALCSPVTTIVFAFDNDFRICGIIRGSMSLYVCTGGRSLSCYLSSTKAICKFSLYFRFTV